MGDLSSRDSITTTELQLHRDCPSCDDSVNVSLYATTYLYVQIILCKRAYSYPFSVGKFRSILIVLFEIFVTIWKSDNRYIFFFLARDL